MQCRENAREANTDVEAHISTPVHSFIYSPAPSAVRPESSDCTCAKRNQGSLEEGVIPDLGQRKWNMCWDCFAFLESSKVLKK